MSKENKPSLPKFKRESMGKPVVPLFTETRPSEEKKETAIVTFPGTLPQVMAGQMETCFGTQPRQTFGRPATPFPLEPSMSGSTETFPFTLPVIPAEDSNGDDFKIPPFPGEGTVKKEPDNVCVFPIPTLGEATDPAKESGIPSDETAQTEEDQSLPVTYFPFAETGIPVEPDKTKAETPLPPVENSAEEDGIPTKDASPVEEAVFSIPDSEDIPKEPDLSDRKPDTVEPFPMEISPETKGPYSETGTKEKPELPYNATTLATPARIEKDIEYIRMDLLFHKLADGKNHEQMVHDIVFPPEMLLLETQIASQDH